MLIRTLNRLLKSMTVEEWMKEHGREPDSHLPLLPCYTWATIDRGVYKEAPDYEKTHRQYIPVSVFKHLPVDKDGDCPVPPYDRFLAYNTRDDAVRALKVALIAAGEI